MIAKKRIRLSAMQRVEVWRRWKAGESLHAIGRALGKNNVVIHLLLKRHGGIAPPIRRRSPSSLTLAEREDISRRVGDGPAQKLHDGYGRTGLLLRSPKPMAARFERKHERVAVAIPAEEGGSVLLLTVGPGRDRSAPQSTATKNIGI